MVGHLVNAYNHSANPSGIKSTQTLTRGWYCYIIRQPSIQPHQWSVRPQKIPFFYFGIFRAYKEAIPRCDVKWHSFFGPADGQDTWQATNNVFVFKTFSKSWDAMLAWASVCVIIKQLKFSSRIRSPFEPFLPYMYFWSDAKSSFNSKLRKKNPKFKAHSWPHATQNPHLICVLKIFLELEEVLL